MTLTTATHRIARSVYSTLVGANVDSSASSTSTLQNDGLQATASPSMVDAILYPNGRPISFGGYITEDNRRKPAGEQGKPSFTKQLFDSWQKTATKIASKLNS